MKITKTTRSKMRQFTLLALILCVLCTILYTSQASSSDIGFDNEKVHYLNAGWVHIQDDGSREPILLPCDLSTPAGEVTVIETVLSNDVTSALSVCLRASMQMVSAYLDDELIYEFGDKETYLDKANPGSAWAMFRLPDKSAGKTLRLELVSPYDEFSGEIGSIYLSTKSSILFAIMREHFMGLLFPIVLVIISLITLILYIVTSVLKYNNKALLYLAIFSFLLSVWIFGESKTLQFFMENAQIVTKLPFYAIFLLPIPFTLYLDCAFEHHTLNYPAFFFWIFVINNVVCTVLDITGTLSFFKSVIVLCVLCILLILSIFITMTYEIVKYHNRDALVHLIGLIILGVSALMETLLMWFNKYYALSSFLRIGLIIYIIYISIATLHKLLRSEQESRERRYYEQLAFTDVLTQGNNRMAFQRDTETIFVPHGNANNWLLLFDLDKLKVINDSIGHDAGDDALKRAYRCIEEAFDNVGTCYRIGGDEFACIACGFYEQRILDCCQKLGSAIQKNQKLVDYQFDISYGMACFDPETDNFHDFYTGVDKKLYTHKNQKRAYAKT